MPKILKEAVISFRIPETYKQKLETELAENPIVGVDSVNKLCRKIVVDRANGKLNYDNEGDQMLDAEIKDLAPQEEEAAQEEPQGEAVGAAQ